MSIIPKTRREKFIANLDGDGIALTPKTRWERFMAKLAGRDVETPAAITREEHILDDLELSRDVEEEPDSNV